MRPLALAVLVLTGCASAPPYARCGGDVACAMGACTEVSYTRDDGSSAEGSFCSSTCATDADCPDEGACIALDHDPTHTFFCVARCTAAGDCYAGLACTSVVAPGGMGFGACLP
jgi:hypothetical protein